MNRNTFQLAGALMLLFVPVWLGGCSRGEPAPQGGRGGRGGPATVRTAPVRRGAISRTLELTGEVVATDRVTVAATVEGPIAFSPWREGDKVPNAGDKLVGIDRELYRAEVLLAEAALEVAKAKLEDLRAGSRPEEIAQAREAVRQMEESATYARADYERTLELVEQGSLAAEALEKSRVQHVAAQANLAAARERLAMAEEGPTRTALAVQEAVVREAEARLAVARAKLDECVVPAPFAGIVTRAHVRPGDMASPRAPLVEMIDPASLVVGFAVPESHAATVKPGDALSAVLDAYPEQELTARIVRIYPELDERLRTRRAEAEIRADVELLPGMFARIVLPLETVEDATIVPSDAVQSDAEGKAFVFVARDGKAERCFVKLGIQQAGRTQVREGLEPGEAVIVAGHENLRDGAEVRTGQPGGSGK